MSNFWTTLIKPFLVLAPMEDVTDFVFREIVAEIAKPDVFFTEFANVDGILSEGRAKVIKRLEYNEKQRPIVAQIWGNNPENFYRVSQLIKELKFEGIDINMGCPDRSVVKGKSGAALIKNPNLAKEIIDATKKGAGDLPISVKTRIGFDKVITEEWISFLLEQKLAAITIHARTAAEMSKVSANWNEIDKAVTLKNKIAPETIIIGNGDVKSYEEALEKHDQYNVDGIMIGRGIFANPWVFEKTKTHKERTSKEKLILLLKHTKLYVEKWGDTKNFEIMKKFFKIYVCGFEGTADLREKLMKCKSYAEVEDVVKITLTSC